MAPTTEGEQPPAAKRSKVVEQSSLLSFFGASKKKTAATSTPSTASTASGQKDDVNITDDTATKNHPAAPAPAVPDAAASTTQAKSSINDDDDEDFSAIVPKATSTPFNVIWETGLYDSHVIVRKSRGKDPDKERVKIAAFDLDGTLLQWSSNSPGFWPSSLSHYELWNKSAITKLQDLYDNRNYRLVLFSNQGAVQKAHTGKKATLVKTLIDWIAMKVDRPIVAVLSTRSPKKSPTQSFHKPSAKMWTDVLTKKICRLNASNPFATAGSGAAVGVDTSGGLDLTNSFFVGDSADPNDPQGGVDFRFAKAVGISFYTPDDYFGPNNQQMRSKAKLYGAGVDIPPPHALKTRSALLGGYLESPILLILCGVQGSGKSSFCERILDGMQRAAYNRGCKQNDDDDTSNDYGGQTDKDIEKLLANDPHRWCILSQDTINNGKPGKREKVEAEARAALTEGRSVVVDRMHLDPEQRRFFIDLASDVGVPAHIVVLNPPKEIIAARVKNRVDHPGKVQGDQGLRLSMQSLDRLVLPKYDEAGDVNKIRLITCVSHDSVACQLAWRYGGLTSLEYSLEIFCKDDNKLKEVDGTGNPKYLQSIPSLSLGTMGMGRRTCTETVEKMLEIGFAGIDTAPTYNNEDKVGESKIFGSGKFTVIGKIPKRAVEPNEVRTEFEQTLKNLKKEKVSLLLLHWPSDVIAAGTLKQVWTTMEELLKEGKCKALGVCNFTPGALATLLSVCTIPPVVNQVERHPLLSQLELVDYCARNNIYIQAHTPLGGGRDELLNHPVVTKIAKEIGRSPAQVLIQWNVQQGIPVTCKTSTDSHGNELFTCPVDRGVKGRKKLSPDHMKALDGMNSGIRFITPPFMYGTGDVYFWGDRIPGKKSSSS
mmetsp:Transcript_35025/g.84760  ORF Transcript_35025/g.84760 Transcript_35025/m.84760 type:complete len:881 (+) Transcript_35025:105-2747(+)